MNGRIVCQRGALNKDMCVKINRRHDRVLTLKLIRYAVLERIMGLVKKLWR